MSKKLWSVFTDDMDHCYFTGTPYCHRHHIFYGPYRSMSEKYGFVIPIAYYLHENYPDSVHQNPNKGIDLELKQMLDGFGSFRDTRYADGSKVFRGTLWNKGRV